MGHVCPWWFAYTFDNPLRRLFHDPEKIFAPYVRPGMRVADIGCGLGYFSLGLARMVRESGRVIAVDIQKQMLHGLERRARNAGLASIIHPLLCRDNTLCISEPLDFALAFWMVHETPEPDSFFRQVHRVLKPEAILLFTEPVFHVGRDVFQREVAMAREAGFRLRGEPGIRFSHTAVLKKGQGNES